MRHSIGYHTGSESVDVERSGVDMAMVQAILTLANERGIALADLPMTAIAQALGVSRMTLYRRIGSRSALHDAVRALGHDPGQEPDARERAIRAASDLIRNDGLGALTMERVAAEAGCALPTVFAIFGNRRRLLMEVFARHIDVPEVGAAFVEVAPGNGQEMRRAVRQMYARIMATIEPELPILQALIGEALRDPKGDAGAYITERHLPAIAEHIVPWFASMIRRGVIRDVPVSIAIQQFLGPIAAHIAMRPLLESQSFLAVPDRETACDLLADQFYRAMATGADEENRQR